MVQPKEPGGAGGVWRRLAPALVLAMLVAAGLFWRVDRYLTFDALAQNREWLLHGVERLGAAAPVVFTLLYTLAAALSIPGAVVLTLAGGFLFGVVLGSICIVIGATAGATILFLVARSAFGEALRRRAGPFVRRLEAGFQEDAFSYLLALRLIPAFPFWLVNLVPALLSVRLRVFVLATFLGIIPATVVYTSLGSGLGAVFDRGERPDLALILRPELLLPLLGLAVLALLPVLYRRWRGAPGGERA
jgi:uncharacterized membrane protein YdjX (TVP38/TMEM64 family)